MRGAEPGSMMSSPAWATWQDFTANKQNKAHVVETVVSLIEMGNVRAGDLSHRRVDTNSVSNYRSAIKLE